MHRARLAAVVLRLDAAANVGLGVALAIGARPIAEALGLTMSWPLLLLVAAVLLANGVLCWRAAGQPSPASLRRLAGVDLAFVAAVLAVAALNPGGAGAGARWVLVAMGDVVAVVAAVKLWCAQGVLERLEPLLTAGTDSGDSPAGSTSRARRDTRPS